MFNPLTGQQVAVIVNPLSLYYEKWVNNTHTYQLVLDADDPCIQYFVTDAIVEVWRRVLGSDWVREVCCFHRTEQYNLEENGRELYTSYGRGVNDLLNRRSILYFANTPFTLKQGPGETVMKELVNENACAAANNAARRSFGQYNAAIPGMTTSPDQGLGLEWKGSMPWRNLLDQLKEIALTTNIDFEVIRIAPLEFCFYTFYPQRGVDHTDSLTFSIQFNNMTNVVYARSRVEEANVVAVLGQGEESSRRVIIRQSPASLNSPWNLIETIRDARNTPDVTGMITVGDTALQEAQAHETFSFNTLQTAARQYGRDYNVGDKVTAEYRDINVVKKITSARVTLSRDAPIETVLLGFSDNVD